MLATEPFSKDAPCTATVSEHQRPPGAAFGTLDTELPEPVGGGGVVFLEHEICDFARRRLNGDFGAGKAGARVDARAGVLLDGKVVDVADCEFVALGLDHIEILQLAVRSGMSDDKLKLLSGSTVCDGEGCHDRMVVLSVR